jgi:hypothetical protein
MDIRKKKVKKMLQKQVNLDDVYGSLSGLLLLITNNISLNNKRLKTCAVLDNLLWHIKYFW